ncbi:hypothetical protein KEJ49_07195 [Candidatus Bathyarchaeota archaeon]|nr:hypothetical protein [Candidatus Bathyarchaeota archaeon]
MRPGAIRWLRSKVGGQVGTEIYRFLSEITAARFKDDEGGGREYPADKGDVMIIGYEKIRTGLAIDLVSRIMS